MKRNCDICGDPATVDTKTITGQWAYLCDSHNNAYGCGIAGLTNVLEELKE